MLRKLIGLFVIAIVAIAATVIVRTLLFIPQSHPPQASVSYPLDKQSLAADYDCAHHAAGRHQTQCAGPGSKRNRKSADSPPRMMLIV